MGFFTGMSDADPIRVLLQVDTFIDNVTGRYFDGARGDRILNGGFGQSVVITGRGNTAKTTTGLQFALKPVERYMAVVAHNDTEDSLNGISRVEELAKRSTPELYESGKLWDRETYVITDSSSSETDSTAKWFDKIRGLILARAKKPTKDDYIITPLLDPYDKKPIRILKPVVPFIDSLSKASLDASEDVKNKTGIDSKDQNMIYARENLYKHRIIGMLPRISAVGGSYWIMTAHMGDQLTFDMSEPEKKLAFLNAKVKFKGVPESVTFLSYLILYSNHSKPLTEGTGAQRVPMYPSGEAVESTFKDPDLLELHMMTLRNKLGPTGIEWFYVYSQKEGFFLPLSYYHFLKNFKWGFDGLGGVWFNLILCPDIKVSRTTIRSKLENTPKLCRALEITLGLFFQLQFSLGNVRRYYREIGGIDKLIERVNASGHITWDEVLETREYWTPDHYTNPKRYLSVEDILRIALGLYVPYWKQAEKPKPKKGEKVVKESTLLDDLLNKTSKESAAIEAEIEAMVEKELAELLG